MKKALLIISFIILNAQFILLYAQVGITTDNSNPDASAMLDVKSTDKGMLIPRMTSAQRTVISNPATGLLVFDITTTSFWFYNGSAWEDLSASTGDEIADTDNDTKIQVEESANEDIIRFDMAGTEFFRMDSGRLEVLNTGNSVFIGEGAGANDDLTNNQNVFIGYIAGNANATGRLNTAIGYKSFNSNISGISNTAIGHMSLSSNTSGSYNTTSGQRSLTTNTTGEANNASGYNSLFNNTTGNQNIAYGAWSLYNNISGNRNSSIGYASLFSNTTGISNVTNGYGALRNNSTGNSNSAVGYQSLYTNSTGSFNSAIGYQADVTTDSLTNTTAIGAYAKVAASNSLVLGGIGTYKVNVGIGTSAPTELLTLVGTSGVDGILFPDSTLQTTAFTGVGDNLGNHNATTNIQLNGYYLSNDGGNEGIAIDNSGNVGISTTSPGNKFHLGEAGGIQLTNSEIADVNINGGTILYDGNYFGSGEAGDGHFNANGGGLAVYDEVDGWGAIVSTANMQYLEMDMSSLHVGGTSDPGDNNLIVDGLTTTAGGVHIGGTSDPGVDNLIVDGVVKIAGGNPGNKKVLTSDANGNATWEDIPTLDKDYAKSTGTTTYDDTDTWRDVTGAAIITAFSGAVKIEANMILRLTEGSGTDDFYVRVKVECSGSTFYTNEIRFRPNEESGEHNNYKVAPYMDLWTSSCANNASMTFTLQVRNTGDDAWEIKERILFVSEY